MASIGDTIRETCLRWFGVATKLVKKRYAMQVDGPPRGRGGPKRTSMEVVKYI